MKVYTLKSRQFLPITLDEAWKFFSNPENLGAITPPHMGFRILYRSGGGEMYPGQLIRYVIRIAPHIPVQWITEITHVMEGKYFIDEQRFGPYALWHHQHHFRKTAGGIEMIDEINYAIPLGILGRLVHALFVGKQVKAIFAYRKEVLEQRFSNPKSIMV